MTKIVPAKWEQDEIPIDIPVYNVEFELKNKSYIVLHVRGDQHVGLKGLDVDQLVNSYKKEQDSHRDNMFVIDTGDWIENGLKRSIGHNYDIGIADPTEQLQLALDIQDKLDTHLYGHNKIKTMKACTRKCTKHARRMGLIGNHEYRSRKESGIWLNNELYSGKGVIDGGIHCIINIKLINKKLKLFKEYKIYAAHRLTNSAAGISTSSILKNFIKKKADVTADIYVCGHYHRKVVIPDVRYTSAGKKRKVLFVANPAPFDNTEYAKWAMYSPIDSGNFANVYLPIGDNENIYGIV